MQGDETTVQSEAGMDTSNQPVVGKRNRYGWLIPVCLIVVPLLILILYFKLMSVGLTNPDAMDFAQVARNLGAGKRLHDLHPPPARSRRKNKPFPTSGYDSRALLSVCPCDLLLGSRGEGHRPPAGISGLFYLLTGSSGLPLRKTPLQFSGRGFSRVALRIEPAHSGLRRFRLAHHALCFSNDRLFSISSILWRPMQRRAPGTQKIRSRSG